MKKYRKALGIALIVLVFAAAFVITGLHDGFGKSALTWGIGIGVVGILLLAAWLLVGDDE